MGDTKYVSFAGLDAPVHLDGASVLLPHLASALPLWPFFTQENQPAKPAFISIRGKTDGTYEIDVPGEISPSRHWDAVNAVCDLVAEMAWEKLRSQPDLLCVHGAAIQFGERLVLFPNSRRAGKSTLACALAHRGHTIFTDDYLTIDLADETGIRGIGNGVAPRLRLPVPKSFSAGFKAWVNSDPGPSNQQYKYLTKAPIADNGAPLYLGAIVILNRQDTTTLPRIETIDQAAAIESMIVQNFARSLHAGIILRSIETLTTSLPCFRLDYHSGEDAAEFLHSHPLMQTLPIAKMAKPEKFSQAPLEEFDRPSVPFDPLVSYVRRAGFSETQTGDTYFLADKTGLTIQRLNAGSAAIWRLLSEPVDLSEMVEILCAAFPDTCPDQIAIDTLMTLQQLASAKLIEPVLHGKQKVAS